MGFGETGAVHLNEKLAGHPSGAGGADGERVGQDAADQVRHARERCPVERSGIRTIDVPAIARGGTGQRAAALAIGDQRVNVRALVAVGGIEAEAVMLGQPLYMLMPEVIGLEMTGELAPGATATDLVLTVTEMLRKEGVVGKFVEFYGSGVATMRLADRATIANMAPEYGATMGFFPVDEETLRYLRGEELITHLGLEYYD